MLTMILIGLPAEVVKLSAAKPNAENQKRLGRFLSFYTSAAAGQRLRQAALCLQLTDFALNITGQKLKTTQHVEREPLMIRLSRGDIEEAAGSTLMRILGVLEADPSLDLFQTIGSLLVTMGHLAMRLAQYKRYPCCLWKLTQKFNSEACVLEIERFLEAQLGDLDIGYSAQLQRDALAKTDGLQSLYERVFLELAHVKLGSPLPETTFEKLEPVSDSQKEVLTKLANLVGSRDLQKDGAGVAFLKEFLEVPVPATKPETEGGGETEAADSKQKAPESSHLEKVDSPSDFKVGDHVMVTMTRDKRKFDQKKGKVESIGTKFIKVSMLEGPAQFESRQFQASGLKRLVALKEPVAPEVPNSETVDKAARAAQLFGDVDGI